MALTLTQVLRALRRRWYVLLLGLALTIVAAQSVWTPHVVYWSQTSVRFVDSTSRPGAENNSLVSSSESLIAFAGLVLADIDSEPGIATSSREVNILDVGIDDGVWIRLPDKGGQWANVFEDALLDVQVAGPTPEEVQQRTTEVVRQIRAAAQRRETGMGGRQAIDVRPVPATPVIAAATGRPTAALGGSVLLGMLSTLGLALGLDHAVGQATRRWNATRSGP